MVKDNCNPSHAQLYIERLEDETLSIATPFCLKPVELIHTRARVTIQKTNWIAFIWVEKKLVDFIIKSIKQNI